MADISKFTPDGGTTEYNFKDAQARADIVSSFSSSETEIRNTVGWTGKNELQIPSNVVSAEIHGITFTVTRNSDGEVTEIDANGTASAEVTFWLIGNGWDYSNCVEIPNWIKDNTAYTLKEDGDSDSTGYIHFVFKNSAGSNPSSWRSYSGAANTPSVIDRTTVKWHGWIRVNNGTTLNHKKFRPMFRQASITDSTFEPYHESVESVLETKGDWDARNIGISIPGLALMGNAEEGYKLTKEQATAITYCAKIKDGQKYVISKASVGNRFRIVVSFNELSYSTSDMTAVQIIREDTSSAMTYEFTNSENYKYLYFTANWDNQIVFDNVEGMIQLASNANKDYTPHRDTLDEVIPSKMTYADNGVLGAKNLCESKCPTSTINGITYTKNADGSYTISGVNDGTNPSTIRIDQSSPTAADNLKSYSGRFTMSLLDANKNYVPDTTMIMMQNSTWSTLMSCNSSNSGIQTADVNASNLFMYITVPKNADFSTPKTVYPMLRLATDPDSTYQPYAMTNRELTSYLTPIISEATNIVEGASVSSDIGNTLWKIGQVVYFSIGLAALSATSMTTNIFEIPEGFRPPKNIFVAGNGTNLRIASSGTVRTTSTVSNIFFQIATSWVVD